MPPEPSKEDRALAAALVHDLGHGPFSHAFEKVGQRLGLKLADHEEMSDRLIRDSEVTAILNKMGGRFANDVADIVRDAGGRVVGRTRLQKIAYLLAVAGLESGLRFTYRHYGPYSEAVATAARDANLLGFLVETEHRATWGGAYSIYDAHPADRPSLPSRMRLATEAAASDSIELELAATAVYLAQEGHPDPWRETARRKPEKAEAGRLESAKTLYTQLSRIPTPNPLSTIPEPRWP